MSRKVLDSYSLLAYFWREKGYEKMIEHLEKATESMRDLLLSVVNWGEVFYIVYREYGPQKAQEVANVIETLPIEIYLRQDTRCPMRTALPPPWLN